MSERDQRFLAIAGLTVSSAAKLFGKTRQALHVGIGKIDDYFNASELLLALQHARRRDLPQLPSIMTFIDDEYVTPAERAAAEKNRPGKTYDVELLLPQLTSIRQLLRACSRASQIVALYNWNLDHIRDNTLFSYALREISEIHRSRLDIIVPDQRWEGYVEKRSGLSELGRVRVAKHEVVELPIFLVASPDARRGFATCKFSIEEINPIDAERLWSGALVSGVEERVGSRILKPKLRR